MRIIKFRAWITEPKELDSYMAYFDLLSEDNRWIKEKNAPIMQFTGLLDKNGVEIYEGDIIRHKFRPSIQGIVEWIEPESGFKMVDYEKTIWSLWIDSKVGEIWEIIGNIYQNPELLPPTIVDKGEK